MGTDQDPVRWRSCVNFVNLNMGVAVGRMYVEEYFSKDARENVSTRCSKNTILFKYDVIYFISRNRVCLFSSGAKQCSTHNCDLGGGERGLTLVQG